MRSSAPGKLVVSGAYVVLDGAPALVASVGAYAFGDASRPAVIRSPEHDAAFGTQHPPYVDSSQMRTAGGRKLGVGSSAASLVAAIGCALWAKDPRLSVQACRTRVANAAYAAHRKAQGGGSGIDVITSTWGGVQRCKLEAAGGPPTHESVRLPKSLRIEIWTCPQSASTKALLKPVRRLKQTEPEQYKQLLRSAYAGARQCSRAVDEGSSRGFLRGLHLQAQAMQKLGATTATPIFTPAMVELSQLADKEAAVFYQAGAGGGDVGLFAGRSPSSAKFRKRALELGLCQAHLDVGVGGLLPTNKRPPTHHRGGENRPGKAKRR